MDEIAVTFFLIGRENTLPLEIWSRLRRGATPEMNAISTLIFVFSFVTISISQRLITGGESRISPGIKYNYWSNTVNPAQ